MNNDLDDIKRSLARIEHMLAIRHRWWFLRRKIAFIVSMVLLIIFAVFFVGTLFLGWGSWHKTVHSVKTVSIK